MFAGLTKLGLFTIRPSVSQENGNIVIRNSLITRVLGLFTHLRKVEFCPVEKAVLYRVRTFWFMSDAIAIPFSQLSHMEFISGSSETGYSESAEGFDAKDTPREYSLALVTMANDMIEICTFGGGDSQQAGQTETESGEPTSIVQQLTNILGIKLKSGTVNRKQIFTRCGRCGRKISRHASLCLYCKE
jgi:hypothetical protein